MESKTRLNVQVKQRTYTLHESNQILGITEVYDKIDNRPIRSVHVRGRTSGIIFSPVDLKLKKKVSSSHDRTTSFVLSLNCLDFKSYLHDTIDFRIYRYIRCNWHERLIYNNLYCGTRLYKF